MSIAEITARLEAFRIRDQIGRQKYPASIIKVGAVLYSYDAFSYDDGSSSVDAHEWHVRSIMRKRGTQTRYGYKQSRRDSYQDKFVHITVKNKDTWGKLSTKQFHRGFFKSIPKNLKDSFKVGDHLPRGVFTTQLAALKHAIKDKTESIARCLKSQKEETDPEEAAEWQEDIDESRKELKLLNTRLTKLKNKKS
jgi:hypothetical protein